MTKKDGNNMNAGPEKPNNPIKFKDFILATSLIILASLAGISLFVFIIVMVNQNEAIREFFSTNPEGTEISNRAMGVGFALAGAFASTVIAFAALTAQSTANRSQEALQTIEQKRIAEISAREKVEARRRDFQRHAVMVRAINHVAADASLIVEDLLENTVRAFEKISTAGHDPDTGPDPATGARKAEERDGLKAMLIADLEASVERSAARIAARHAEFWAVMESMSGIEQQELSLDALWKKQFSASEPLSLLRKLAGDTSFFGNPVPDSKLLPSELSHRIMTMQPERVAWLTSLLYAATIEAVGRQLHGKIGKHLARLDRSTRDHYAKLTDSFEALGELLQETPKLSVAIEDLETVSNEIKAIQTTIAEASGRAGGKGLAFSDMGFEDEELSEAIRGEQKRVLGLMDKLETQVETLRQRVDEVLQLQTRVAELGRAAQGHATSLEEGVALMRDVYSAVVPTIRTGMVTRKHMPAQTTVTELELLRFVIGAVVIPDGAILALTDAPERDDPQPQSLDGTTAEVAATAAADAQPVPEDSAESPAGPPPEPRWVWSVNLGLAFLADLSSLYMPDAKRADAESFDLCEDYSFVGGHGFAPEDTEGEDDFTQVLRDRLDRQTKLSAPIMVGFDPIWLHLSRSLAAQDLHWVVGTHEDGAFVTGALLREPAGSPDGPAADGQLEADVTPTALPRDHRLILHPALFEPLRDGSSGVPRTVIEKALQRVVPTPPVTEADETDEDDHIPF